MKLYIQKFADGSFKIRSVRTRRTEGRNRQAYAADKATARKEISRIVHEVRGEVAPP